MADRNSVRRATLGFALAAILAGCAGDPTGYYGPGPQENTGTLVGAGTGALLGAAIAGPGVGNAVGGAVVGGLIGGLLGNRIGASLDERDRRMAYAAELQALNNGPPGAPVAWRNPDSGRYGSIVPGPVYVENARNCRAFTHTIYVDGRPQTARGTACRNPDGSWTPVG
jgi:surface antigen